MEGGRTRVGAPAHLLREDRRRGRDRWATLWREATNFPVCEPVGLGVAVRRARPACPVAVHLDTDGPVLVDHHPQSEQEWRADLQRMSREDAARTGVPVDPRPLTAGEIREAVGRGERVLLLVSLARMQGFDVPHWVLCHGAVPDALVIEDPWTGAERGRAGSTPTSCPSPTPNSTRCPPSPPTASTAP